jgi:DNA-binding IscR family transcriptional regulator
MDPAIQGSADDGFHVLMEMASAPTGLSRSALKTRCGLSPQKLDDALGLLTRSGLVRRGRGPRGRYSLAHAPQEISLRQLQGHLGRRTRPNRKRASGSGDSSLKTLLADLDRNTTLAELMDATASLDDGLCPYYDACVALGGPEGPAVRQDCRGQCI